MATVTVSSITKYTNSSSGSSSIIGYEGGKYRTYVIAFTVDESATKLQVKIDAGVWNTDYRACSIYGSVGTNATEWLNYAGTAGTLIGTVAKGTKKDTAFKWDATIEGLTLLPGTTYYLSLYHYTNAYACVYVENNDITLSASDPVSYNINYLMGPYSDAGQEYSVSVIHGQSLTLPGRVFQRYGYTQVGWAIEGSGGYDIYDLAYVISDITSDYDVVPVWNANEYRVIFDINGADSGESFEIACVYDDDSQLTPRPASHYIDKDYHDFAGWCTASDGNGDWYYDGDPLFNLIDSGSVTLYAQWEHRFNYVEFRIDNGQSDFELIKYEGVPLTLPDALLYLPDIRLAQTVFDAGLGSADYTVYTHEIDVTPCFSHWEFGLDGEAYAAKATYTYDTGSSNDVVCFYAISTVTPRVQSSDVLDLTTVNQATRTGYHFRGWYETAECAGSPIETHAPLADCTLYAKWEPKEYSIYFVDVGTDSFAEPTLLQTCLFDSSITLPTITKSSIYRTNTPPYPISTRGGVWASLNGVDFSAEASQYTLQFGVESLRKYSVSGYAFGTTSTSFPNKVSGLTYTHTVDSDVYISYSIARTTYGREIIDFSGSFTEPALQYFGDEYELLGWQLYYGWSKAPSFVTPTSKVIIEYANSNDFGTYTPPAGAAQVFAYYTPVVRLKSRFKAFVKKTDSGPWHRATLLFNVNDDFERQDGVLLRTSSGWLGPEAAE